VIPILKVYYSRRQMNQRHVRVTGNWETRLEKEVVRVVREVYLKISELRGEGLINKYNFLSNRRVRESLFEMVITCFHSCIVGVYLARAE